MTGNARNLRRWPRSSTILRPTVIFNPQGHVSVLTTAGASSVSPHGRSTSVSVLTTGALAEIVQSLHTLPTAVLTVLASDNRAFVSHNVSVDSLTTGASYNSLSIAPVDAFFVSVLTTTGGGIGTSTLRASTPEVLTSLAGSVLAIILPRDIATSVDTSAGLSVVTAVTHNISAEALSTLGAVTRALTVGSTILSVTTDVGVHVAAQSLKQSLISVLNAAGVSLETQSVKQVPTGSEVSVAVIPLTDSSHNAPITVAIVSTIGVSTGAEVEHNTEPLATVVTMGADAPAITSAETFIEVLTSAGLDTATALHLAVNPILILRTSVGGTSMIQLGAEKMVEIEETQPGVTVDV